MRLFEFGGVPRQGRLVVGDEAVGLPAELLASTDRTRPKGVLVAVEQEHVRVCVDGSTPTQGVNGLGIDYAPDDAILLRHPVAVERFRAVCRGSSQPAVLQIVVEW